MIAKDNLQLISYLTAAEIYDKSQNIYECFLPIVESVLISNEGKNKITFNSLQNQINTSYHIDMPKSTLKRLLDILQEQKKVKLSTNKMVVLVKDKISTAFWEKRSDREIIIGDFFIEFNSYLLNVGFDIPLQQIKTECCNWLYANSLKLASFINNGILNKRQQVVSDEKDWEFSNQLVDFLLQIRDTKSNLFKTFLLLYNGAVHTSLLNFEVEQINDVCGSSLHFENLILDTNFILRMLDLQSEFDCVIASDTISTLNRYNSHFFVLEQTIEEIQKSVKNYLYESEPYTIYTQTYFKNSKIRMNGFYEASKRGISRSEFLSFTRKEYIKSKISEMIDVIFVDDFDSKQITSEQIESLIASKNRDNYGISQAQHDLCLIEFCKKNRNENFSSLENIKFWVLTNDEKLTYWNQCNSIDFQECLTEIQLSNLMWIQKRKTDNLGLVQTILSLSSSTALSLQGIECFANRIHTYQEKNKDNRESLDKLSLIFASHALSLSDILKINHEEKILDNIIEEKVLAIREEEIIRKQKNKELEDQENQLSKENSNLGNRVSALNIKIGIQNNNQKIFKYEEDIKDIEREKEIYSNECEIYTDIGNYRNRHKKFAARLVCLFSITPMFLILFCYIVFWQSKINILFERVDKFSGFTQTIISDILIPIISIGLYYFIITMIFSTPLSPKELFNSLRNIFLNFVCERHFYKKGISINYVKCDIKKGIRECTCKIECLNNEIDNLKAKISDLNAMNNFLNTLYHKFY